MCVCVRLHYTNYIEVCMSGDPEALDLSTHRIMTIPITLEDVCAVCCSVLQCVSLFCSVLQCFVVQCNVT